MTEPTEFDQSEAMIPGLEPAKRGESAMVSATRRTIAQLHRDGLVEERHSILTQQLLELADVVDAGRRQGRASAVAMAAAQILATWQILVPDSEEGGDGDDAWSALVAELRRSGPAARDATEPPPPQ